MLSEVLLECKRHSAKYKHHKVVEPVTLAKHLIKSPKGSMTAFQSTNHDFPCIKFHPISKMVLFPFYLKAGRKRVLIIYNTSTEQGLLITFLLL